MFPNCIVVFSQSPSFTVYGGLHTAREMAFWQYDVTLLLFPPFKTKPCFVVIIRLERGLVVKIEITSSGGLSWLTGITRLTTSCLWPREEIRLCKF